MDRDREAWQTNLEAVVHEADPADELARLRQAARGVEEAPKEDEKKEKQDERKKDKKKKKEAAKKKEAEKKKKKEKKPVRDEADRKREAATVSSSSSESPGKEEGKNLELIFEGTGLDPNYKKRMKVLKRARKVGKKVKKKKKKKDSEGSDDSQSRLRAALWDPLRGLGVFLNQNGRPKRSGGNAPGP